MNRLNDFAYRYAMLPLAILSLPLLLFAEYFQTEGFVLVSLYACVIAMLVGLVLGVWFMHYITQLEVSENIGKRLKEQDVVRIMGSVILCELLFLFLTFCANSVPAFLLGAGGVSVCVTSLVYYLIFEKLRKKKAEQ